MQHGLHNERLGDALPAFSLRGPFFYPHCAKQPHPDTTTVGSQEQQCLCGGAQLSLHPAAPLADFQAPEGRKVLAQPHVAVWRESFFILLKRLISQELPLCAAGRDPHFGPGCSVEGKLSLTHRVVGMCHLQSAQPAPLHPCENLPPPLALCSLQPSTCSLSIAPQVTEKGGPFPLASLIFIIYECKKYYNQ